MANGDLSAQAEEQVRLEERVDQQINSAIGLVAVLDALGTKALTRDEAVDFIRRREVIARFAGDVIETSLPGLQTTRLQRFTFNDTIVYVYTPPSAVTLQEVERFCHLLRVFEMRSIVENMPFRGCFSIGEYYIGDPQTVLGPAINDAASWFESTDWIGIHATPHATIAVQSMLEEAEDRALIDHVLVDYDVPLKGGQTLKVKAVNWPKGFWVRGLRPAGTGHTRGLLLAALARCRVPKTTESKYFKTIAFFDYVEEQQSLEDRFTQNGPSRPPPGTR